MYLPLSGTVFVHSLVLVAEYLRYFPFELSASNIELHVILIIVLKVVKKEHFKKSHCSAYSYYTYYNLPKYLH